MCQKTFRVFRVLRVIRDSDKKVKKKILLTRDKSVEVGGWKIGWVEEWKVFVKKPDSRGVKGV